MTGRFITIEGGEGAGKSTMMDYAADWLAQAGHRVVKTREPGGTELAEKLREILLDRSHVALSSQAELLLRFASRSQHLSELIRPALARGDTVLCDRFTDATWAYQGGGRGVPRNDIATLEGLVHGDLQPDLTILLDAPVETAMSRAGRRGKPDRFEIEQADFFQRVRETYLRLASSAPGRFVIVDVSRDLEGVRAEIRSIAEAMFDDNLD